MLKYLDEWPSPPIRVRDGQAREEENDGILHWEIVQNDGKRDNLKALVNLKQIISVQLPKMPKNYITRLVFDNQHKSLVGVKNGKIIGGITFRPFKKEGCTSSIEIVFCVITKDEQRGGYGSRLMNQLKHWCQQNDFLHLLTYADDTAIGYFQRQGFSCEIGMATEEWDIGYLKYYDSATLMHCKIDTVISYLEATSTLRLQRASFYKKMRELSNQHRVYKGVNLEPGRRSINMNKVEGLIEAGWTSYNLDKLLAKDNQEAIYNENNDLLQRILNDSDISDPFTAPVTEMYPGIAESYCAVVSDPIDLRTIGERLDDGYYITREMFIADLHRMIENCKTYLRQIYTQNKAKGGQKVEKDPLFVQAETLNTLYLKGTKEELGVINMTTNPNL